jgi:hypothetical protein
MLLLLEASGRRPPEDVGGPVGYATFPAAIADAAYPDGADALQWAPAGFDPATVNQAKLERRLDALARRWSPRGTEGNQVKANLRGLPVTAYDCPHCGHKKTRQEAGF